MFKLPCEVSLPRVQSLPSLRPCRLAVYSTYVHIPAALPPLSRRKRETDQTASTSLDRPIPQEVFGNSSTDISAALPSQAKSRPPCSRLHLESEGAESLTLTSAGEFFLIRKCEQNRSHQKIVSHGSVTLPIGAAPETFRIDRQVFKGQKVVEAHVSWNNNGQCVARMAIYSSEIASSHYEWCKVRFSSGHQGCSFLQTYLCCMHADMRVLDNLHNAEAAYALVLCSSIKVYACRASCRVFAPEKVG